MILLVYKPSKVSLSRIHSHVQDLAQQLPLSFSNTRDQISKSAEITSDIMNPLKELLNQGQSIWLDSIQGGLIRSGELERFVEEYEVRGLTSNPTIFEKAIAGSTD